MGQMTMRTASDETLYPFFYFFILVTSIESYSKFNINGAGILCEITGEDPEVQLLILNK